MHQPLSINHRHPGYNCQPDFISPECHKTGKIYVKNIHIYHIYENINLSVHISISLSQLSFNPNPNPH